MSIQAKAQEIIEEFAFFSDWTEKYEHLIELGKDLPIINAEHKIADNLIKGCQSQVWLHAEVADGKIHFTADSDAIITKGIISLLVRVLSDETATDVQTADMAFINEIGLKEHLSPTRANGLVSMIKQMKMYAIAYQAN